MRVEQLLGQQALAQSRSAPQRLLDRGAVRWLGPAGWLVAAKAGEDVPPDCRVEITDDAAVRFVSRAIAGDDDNREFSVCAAPLRAAISRKPSP